MGRPVRPQTIRARRTYELSVTRGAPAPGPGGGLPHACFGPGPARPIRPAGERIDVLSSHVAQETVCGKCRLSSQGARRPTPLSRDAQGPDLRAPAAEMGERRGASRQAAREQPRVAAPQALPAGLRISLADYDAMLQRQGSACAICRRSGDALCVDHCHACGKVRGLLCVSATACSGSATTAPRFCWRRPPTCGPRATTRGRCP